MAEGTKNVLPAPDSNVPLREAPSPAAVSRFRPEPARDTADTSAGVSFAKRTLPKPSVLYSTLWRFASERHRIYLQRITGQPHPWTSDPVLSSYRFTNVFRAADRVSQYLILCEPRRGTHVPSPPPYPSTGIMHPSARAAMRRARSSVASGNPRRIASSRYVAS